MSTSLTLTFAGLYGLVASNVGRRTHEIGIRMAVGADGPRVLKLVLGQGLRLSAVGLALGVLLAMGADRAMRAAFQGGSGGRDLAERLLVIAATALLTGVAAHLPARRATRIEPTRALRCE